MKTAVQAGIILGLITGLIIGLHSGTWIPTGDPEQDRVLRPRADFMAFYASGALIRESASHLYDLDRQARAEQAATGLEISRTDPDFLPFAYPAVVALLFAPFTVFSYKTAYFILMALNVSLLSVTLALLADRLGLDREKSKVLVLCAAAFAPVYSVLMQGQLSFLVLLLYVLIIANLRSGNVGRAGVWGGLLAFKPTLLPVLFFWFGIRRYWRALGSAALIASGMAVLSILLVGVEGTTRILSVSSEVARGDLIRPRDNFNIMAITQFFGLGDSAWLIASIAVVAALAFSRLKESAGDWAYCALILAAILSAPHLKVYELDLALIVAGIVLMRLDPTPAVRWFLFLSMMLPTAYLAYSGRQVMSPWPVIPVLVLLLFIFFLGFNRRIGRLAQT
jgi:hypothetical protein